MITKDPKIHRVYPLLIQKKYWELIIIFEKSHYRVQWQPFLLSDMRQAPFPNKEVDEGTRLLYFSTIIYIIIFLLSH